MNCMKKPEWPRTIKVGSAVVKIYCSKHPKTKSGLIYTVAFVGLDGKRRLPQFTDPDDAIAEAKSKAEAIAKGRPELTNLSRHDLDELIELRSIANSGGTPAVTAMREWLKAREVSNGHVVAAAHAWAARNPSGEVAAASLATVVDEFIAAKEAAKIQGEQTYRRKFSPLVEFFKDRDIGTITGGELQAFLATFHDAVTRNDRRSRLVTLWKWAQKTGRLARGVQLEVEFTDKARETVREIGIISATTWAKLLRLVHAEAPQHLAALVLAGFCGIRCDEIHGKRHDRAQRQAWEDVFIDRGFVRVTNAKQNTAAWRHVPLCPAAVAWLRLCTEEKAGFVCEPIAVEKVRRLGQEKGLKLPPNCFRHSFISCRVAALDGNKPQVATEAGNSVAKIDRRYRVPLTKEEGQAWFEVLP